MTVLELYAELWKRIEGGEGDQTVTYDGGFTVRYVRSIPGSVDLSRHAPEPRPDAPEGR